MYAVGRVLPVVAVQIAPANGWPAAASAEDAAAPTRAPAASPAAPALSPIDTPTVPTESVSALEQRMLDACSAGLTRARCVSAHEAGADAKAIAVVSWRSPEHASIEVGLADHERAVWVSRELDFIAADPASERWRAVGFTIALLVDDPRFWSQIAEEEEPVTAPVVTDVSDRQETSAVAVGTGTRLELRGLTGAGLVSGAWRWGAELRLSVPLSGALFVTGSVNYSLARQTALDLRWFDASLGVGLAAPRLFADVSGRLRLELVAENIAATVREGELSDARNAWVPGAFVGGDLLVPLGGLWSLSGRADAFWLDGSTVIAAAGQRLATSAGTGVLLGVGAGFAF
jgi:hypothetical protein